MLRSIVRQPVAGGNTSPNNILSTLVFAPGTSKLFGTIVRGDWKIRKANISIYQDIK